MTDKTQEATQEKADVRVFSVREVRELQKAQRRLTLANNKMYEFMMSGSSSEEELERIEAEQDTKLAIFRGMLVKAIRFIPRSWLVEDAPKDIAWDDPFDMDWLKQNRAQEVTDMAMGRLVDEDSKN